MFLNQKFLAALSLSVATFSIPAVALYDSRSAVKMLTPSNFNSFVHQNDYPVFVEFFAPWCGHCKNFAPAYEKAARSLKGYAKVGAVDCDQADNKPLCGKYNVQGFPTVKFFAAKIPKGQSEKIDSDYQGPREARDLVDFGLARLPSFSKKITSKETDKKSMNVDEFLNLKKDELSRVILFTNKDKTTAMWKSLSIEFRKRLILAEAQQSDKELVEKYNVKEFPTIVILPKGGEPKFYKGEIKRDHIASELDEYAIPAPDGKKRGKPVSTPKEAFDPKIPEIKDQESFSKLCLKSEKKGACVITFFDPNAREKSRQEDLKVVQEVKKKFFEKGVKDIIFSKCEGIPEGIKKDFGVPDGLPGMLMLVPKKKVFRTFLGAFDEEKLYSFIDQVNRGMMKATLYDFEPTYSLKEEKKKPKKEEL